MKFSRILGWLAISAYFILPVALLTCALGYCFGDQSTVTPLIAIPCKVVEVYDGDTVTVETTIRIRVRLLDCWAPEVKTINPVERSYGVYARETLKDLVEDQACLLTVPLEGVDRLDDVFTFGRLLGRLQLPNGLDAADEMVRMGAAASEKP